MLERQRSKVLLQYEFRRTWWILVLGILFSLGMAGALWYHLENILGDSYLAAVGHSSDLYYGVDGHLGSIFSEALCDVLQYGYALVVFVFSLIAIHVFRDQDKRDTREYLETLPFHSSERFWAKVLGGYGVIILSWLLMLAGILILRQAYIGEIYERALLSPWYQAILDNETIWNVIRSLLLFLVTMLAVYSVYVMMHMLVKNGKLASLMGIGVITASLLFVVIYANFTDEMSDVFTSSFTRFIYNHELDGKAIPYDLASTFWGFNCGKVTELNMEGYSNRIVLYDGIGIRFAEMIAVSLISVGIAVLARRKRDLSKNTSVVPLKTARIILAAGMGICFGFAFALLCTYSLNVTQEVFINIVFPIWAVVCSFAAYFLLNLKTRN